MKTLYLIVPFAPLIGALLAGLFGRQIGRTLSHVVTIAGVGVSLPAIPSMARFTHGLSSIP
jgi:NADH-quinone oxidoreductase subunit L